MAAPSHPFDLKLLTASKDIGLRRMRSYAASLGGGAQIFHAAEDLLKSLASAGRPAFRSIVLHDTSVVVTAAEIEALKQHARLFQLQEPGPDGSAAMPTRTATCWTLESYMRCSMTAFLEAPIVRMSMANLCKAHGPFRVEHLLRWGYSAQHWREGDTKSLADASQAFVRSLSLAGENRRLAEMAGHFLQAALPGLGLDERSVTFGADGLTTMIVARCEPRRGVDVARIAGEIGVYDFPVAIVNQLSDGLIEVAALYHPANVEGRMLMVFRKDETLADAARDPDGGSGPSLEKAG